MYIVCFIPDILPFLPYYAIIILGSVKILSQIHFIRQ